MEKILVGQYGDVLSFDTETDALVLDRQDIYTDKLFKVTRDGQVITKDKVINVKAGEYVLTMHTYLNNKDSQNAIVISDPACIYDLDEWKKLLNLSEEQMKEKLDKNEVS